MSGTPQTTNQPGTQTAPPPPPPNGGGIGGDSTPPPAAADWIAGLTPELRNVVEVKGYKTPADVVQAYAHAQKAIGADKITLPNAEGQWDDLAREKLGIPKDATGYKIERPNLAAGLQYDEKFEQAALPVAHKLGLTPGQVKGLMEFYTGYQSNAYAESMQAKGNDETAAMTALKAEFGSSYDVQIQRAQLAARLYGGEQLIHMLNRTGLGNNPELIRAFAKIGGQLSEDQLKVGQGMGFGLTPEQARLEANKLMHSEPYNKKDHPEHAAVVQKVQALFEQAYPSNT